MPALPFRITIGPRRDDGSFPVQARTEDGSADATMELPETLIGLGERLLQPYATAPGSDLESIGRQLGRALFTPRLRGLLVEQARTAAQANQRVQIQLQINVPELAALPWEWLSIGTGKPWIPAMREDYTIVRVGRQTPPAAPIVVEGPLRILAAAGPGQRAQLDALVAALSEAVRDKLISIDLLPDTDLDEISRVLEQRQFHILHLAAPAAITPDQELTLAIGRGIDAFDLADLLATQQTLRIVTLTGGVATSLDACAAPALLGAVLMTGQISAAITLGVTLPALASAQLTATIYAALADGAAPDVAISLGRRTLAETSIPSWGSAQLRMLPGTEQLFAFRPAPRPRLTPQRLLPAAIAATLLVALILAVRSFGARGTPTTQSATLPTPTSARAGFLLPQIPAILPTASPTVPTPSTAALPEPKSYLVYTVALSDTLDSIASTTGSDPSAIAVLNLLGAQTEPRQGRSLVVPVYRDGATNPGGMVVARGNPNENTVALTFDIEIDDKSVYSILETLRARSIKATFFVTGRWVQAFPEAARAIVRDGHEIGNHSYTHPYFSRIGFDGALAELNATEKAVREITGTTTRPYFRFPYGDSTNDMLTLLAKQGYIAYHWSTDDAGLPAWLAQANTNPASARGAILLFHGRADTATNLPGWLDQVTAAGFRPVPLTEALR